MLLVYIPRFDLFGRVLHSRNRTPTIVIIDIMNSNQHIKTLKTMLHLSPFIRISDCRELFASLSIHRILEAGMIGIKSAVHQNVLRVIQIGDFTRKPMHFAKIFNTTQST